MTLAPPSPDLESAWQTLRQQAEWAEGFWMAWLFTDQPAAADTLCRRLGGHLAEQGRGLDTFSAEAAEDVDPILDALLSGERKTSYAWVSVRRQDEAAIAAWDRLMMRLNERRERLIRRREAGVVFVVPTALKPRSREAAPDLWSMRSLVLDLSAPRAAALTEPMSTGYQRGPVAEPRPDITLALRAVERSRAAGDDASVAEALCRVAEGLLAEGDVGGAHDCALKAAAVAPEGWPRARACWVLGRTEVALGDLIAAEHHVSEAVTRAADGAPPDWLLNLARLRWRRGRQTEAIRTARLAVERARKQGSEWLPHALRDLGEMTFTQGDIDTAEAAYGELVQIDRLRRNASPRAPQTAGDLADSLLRLAYVSAARERWADALSMASEAQNLATAAETGAASEPGLFRGLAGAATKAVGDMLVALGRWHEAGQALDEALRLAVGAAALSPDNSDLARLVARTHGDRGLVFGMLGDLDQALTHFEAAVRVSDTQPAGVRSSLEWQAVRTEALAHRGHALLDLGRIDEARGTLEAAECAARIIVGRRPESLEAQRLLASTLYRLGVLGRPGAYAECIARLETLGSEHPLSARDQEMLRRARERERGAP